MTKVRKTTIKVLAVICAVCLAASAVSVYHHSTGGVTSAVADTSDIVEVDSSLVDTQTEKYFDSDNVYQLTDTVKADTDISVIVSLNEQDTVMDAYDKTVTNLSFSEYAATPAASKAKNAVTSANSSLIRRLNKSGLDYEIGDTYDTILSGFEITIKAGDYSKFAELLPEATLIVGEEYEVCATEVVTNDVDVYDTGIFDSSSSKYQGDGVVVAVLDTGLDYTHTAMSVENFTTSDEAFTLSTVNSHIADLSASTTTAGLTAQDVYINAKIPYQYDYADKDADVFPISSEHGTHVSGIIAGQDDVITGVAPNAQIAMMKVFSDSSSGAKTSWILAALEDCVTLGVDVINLSLGAACGFSREVDKDNVNVMYDKVQEAGISLIVAAGNEYNSTMNSEKNGNNALTTNPDSGTIGSPASYDASLAVASVSGVMSNYLLYGDEIIYFNEATDSTATTKSFTEDLLNVMGVADDDMGTYEVEYCVIPGIGRSSDYPLSDYTGKIVLVKRGTTTFEEKIRIAIQDKHALGIIIYNNVSGTISMSIGSNEGAAACSISQDDGELLAAAEGGTGKLLVSRSQTAGPFMSDFSSWGPTSDLGLKPEITAHGGDIYSCVPGQGYDRLSGTSMACPNQSGVTALIRQYVKENAASFGISATNTVAVTSIVNQLMMSTADIIYAQNGLPYSVRKQGAGLVNLSAAQTSASYVTTYDKNGDAMDRTKIELGDDKDRTGVYEMTFDINNISSSSVTYLVDSIIQTEGVSTTYTGHGDTTITQEGELLSGTKTEVINVSGGGVNGNEVTVSAGGSAKVTVRITLSEEDKEYMDESFLYGMYVEGFITLEQLSGGDVNMNVPMLAFYGDWTEAPIFDEEYYDTNVDEINAAIDDDDKLMADMYATRVVGGLYDDYIAYMGTYYFEQDPTAVQIAASKDHIALSNQDSSTSYTISSIEYIYAGLLRSAKRLDMEVVEDVTGKVIYRNSTYNQRKAYYSYPLSAIEIEDFSTKGLNLKNNTQYTFTITAYLDYGDEDTYDTQNNVRNTFTFPVFVDFEAPIVTDANFYTEYDETTKKTSLFVDLDVYDNHYAMAVQPGWVTLSSDPKYLCSLETFGRYFTPVYSSFNSTSTVTLELTDYMSYIKDSTSLVYYSDGSYELLDNTNSFIVVCYDYAMNSAIYEIRIPDEVISMYFDGDNIVTENGESSITLTRNETLDLTSVLNVYPSTTWLQALDYTSSDESVVRVVNQTALAIAEGTSYITVTGYTSSGTEISIRLKIVVSGYVGYTLPIVNSFSLTEYYVNKAYYATSSDDREIGLTGYTYSFGSDYSLSMFPSESVTVSYSLDSYFPDETYVVYSVGNSNIATVDQDGTIVAQAEGTTTVTATVYYNGSAQMYSARISITVKDPFTTNSIYLMSYKGLGGTVQIPTDRGITTIYQFAFSNYEYVPKDLEAGDVIDDEDPYASKQWFIGDDTITKIIIPEGVKEIDSYAFANLTALEEVVFPSTLTRIGNGAFYGCTSLTTITWANNDGSPAENNMQFINDYAFYNCTSLEEIDLSSVVAIGNYAFQNCSLTKITLPETAQSLGEGAFYNNRNLASVTITASSVKLGQYAFAYCSSLYSMSVNASVIPAYAFYGCTSLTSITLGRSVSVINEFAFAGTSISEFSIHAFNTTLSTNSAKNQIYKDTDGGLELIAVAPMTSGSVTVDSKVTAITTGAFAGNSNITSVSASGVTVIGSYAFAYCDNLISVSFGTLTEIGSYAFYNTAITSIPDNNLSEFEAYSFAYTKLSGTLTLASGVNVKEGAFRGSSIAVLVIGDDAQIGAYAFADCGSLRTVTIGNDAVIAEYAFAILYDDDVMSYDDWSDKYPDHENDDEYYITYILPYYDEYESFGTDLATGDQVSFVDRYGVYNYSFDIYKAANSSLTAVSIGENCSIGSYAFYNAVSLTSLELGDGTVIGDYAFYNCVSLENADLSGVVSVGAYAFSAMVDGMPDTMVQFYSDGSVYVYGYAYVGAKISGRYVTEIDGYKYTYFYGAFSGSVDLSGASYIGEGAFMNNPGIEEIILSPDIDTISDYAFYGSESLASVDLENVSYVGAYAFAYTSLTDIELADDARIEDGAFYCCEELSVVNGLENAMYVGAYAFYGTALSEINLSNAEYVGDFAFALISTEEVDVELGSRLSSLGENPFYMTYTTGFEYEEEIYFNGEFMGTDVVSTYDVSDTVMVIDGVLYQELATGLELVSYPLSKTDTNYTVEDGTVRISAKAFADNTYLQIVTLNSELQSIGDKAFYGCENLSVVIFTSYTAPLLEEEYDEDYCLYTNHPMSVLYGGYEGLGIVDYYEWSLGYVNFFYGANFVDYIGKIENKLVMVYPGNGENYDSFTYAQYFGTYITGSNAATSATLSVIGMIAALPSNITLEDREAVEAARAAYDALVTEQQALVSNYNTLYSAEQTIKFYESQESTVVDEVVEEDKENGFVTFLKNNWIGLTIAAVILVAFIVYIVVTCVRRRNGGDGSNGNMEAQTATN